MLSYADAQVQERFKRLASQLRLAARHPHDPDAIHDMRVATRRFMQGLKGKNRCMSEDVVIAHHNGTLGHDVPIRCELRRVRCVIAYGA